MRRSYITGFGAYYKKAGRAYGRPPSVVNHPDGRVIIRHAEYLEDVPSATAFAIATYPLNPGMQQTFPWLSRIAQNFEEWLPRGIFFEFKTTSSDMIVTGATTPALGQISMATQYNSLDSDFINNVQLLNYENASTCKPSQNLRHYVECKRSQTVMDEMYIRTGSIPPNADLRLYDLGKTSVSASNMQTNGQMMGQLWISYEIELRKPKIPQDPIDGNAAHFQIPNGIVGQDVAHPFGTSPLSVIRPTTGSTIQEAWCQGQAVGGRVNFQNDVTGNMVLIVCYLNSSASDPAAPTFSNLVNCTFLNSWVNNTTIGVHAPDASHSTPLLPRMWSGLMQLTGQNAAFTFGYAGDAATITGYSDLYISQLPVTLN